jgi:hypothetical protein
MPYEYYNKFTRLQHIRAEITEQVAKNVKAVLHVANYDFHLANPKVISPKGVSVQDLFSRLSPHTVDTVEVFEEKNNSDMLRRIVFWKKGRQVGTIGCRAIDGLPPLSEHAQLSIALAKAGKGHYGDS